MTPTSVATTRKPDCRTDRLGHEPEAHRAFGHDLDDDGQDHQSQDVVRDCGAEHDPRLRRRQGAQIAEHASGDADAGGCQSGPDEERSVTRLAETEPDGPTQGERHRDTDDCHQHRGPAEGAQLGQVHLHPDLHEQQEHAELGQRHHWFAVRRDPTEQRWPDEHADHDLAHDGWHTHALARFGSQLRGDQDQCQIGEHRPIVRVDAARRSHTHARHAAETNATRARRSNRRAFRTPRVGRRRTMRRRSDTITRR